MDVVIFWLLGSIVVGVIASSRHRSGVGWFLLSCVISPLLAGILVLALGAPASSIAAHGPAFVADYVYGGAPLKRDVDGTVVAMLAGGPVRFRSSEQLKAALGDAATPADEAWMAKAFYVPRRYRPPARWEVQLRRTVAVVVIVVVAVAIYIARQTPPNIPAAPVIAAEPAAKAAGPQVIPTTAPVRQTSAPQPQAKQQRTGAPTSLAPPAQR